MSALIFEYAQFVPHAVFQLTDLTVNSARGPVFAPLTTCLPSPAPVAVIGGHSAGKSSLLLALAGRMRGVEGSLEVLGTDAITHPGQVRQLVSVARIFDIVTLEPLLTIEDSITERALADAAGRSWMVNYLHTARVIGFEARRTELVKDLRPSDRAALALCLATVRDTSLVVLDDLDRAVPLSQQRQLWAGLEALAEEGVTVVASTTEADAVPPGAHRIHLGQAHD